MTESSNNSTPEKETPETEAAETEATETKTPEKEASQAKTSETKAPETKTPDAQDTAPAETKIRSKRKLISGANAAVVIAATLGIAVMVNAVSSQVFGRIDLTENQIYTLSPASKTAVANLPQAVHVKAFISPNLPPPLHNLSQSVGDTLDEYAAASAGKLTWEVINPGDDADVEEDARSFGCEKVAIGQRSEDEVSLRAVYKCVAFSMGESLEVVGDLQAAPGGALANFEYDFTKALLNLQHTEPRKVGFVDGFGGPVSNPQFLASVEPAFTQLYGELIKVTGVDLGAEGATVPDDVSTLVILNAEEKFSDQAIFALDQFIQRGGSVGWFQSSTVPDFGLMRQMMQQMPGQQPPPFRRPADPGLSPVFAAYGLELRQDIVLDPQHGTTALMMTPQGLAQITQPATFLMDDIDTSLPFMRNFGVLALPAPSTIQVKSAAEENEALKVHRIVQTGDAALRRTNLPQVFSWETLSQREAGEQAGKWTVAAAIEGDVASYYDSNPLPDSLKDKTLAEKGKSSRILVVGSGEFFQPVPELGYDREFAGLGGQFLIGSIEWLVQDTALSEIRSKAMPHLLGEVPLETQRSLQFVNIAAVPALFALVGVAMRARRRRRKLALQRH